MRNVRLWLRLRRPKQPDLLRPVEAPAVPLGERLAEPEWPDALDYVRATTRHLEETDG
jgi:hypothetical protein